MWLNRLSTMPQFEDEDRTRIASVLHTGLTVLLLLCLLGFLLVPITQQPLAISGILSTLLAACLIGLFLLHKGRIYWAGGICCGTFWGITTLIALFSGGMASPIIFAYAGAITVAGLVFSRRVAGWVTVISILSCSLLAFLTTRAMLPATLIRPNMLMAWVVTASTFVWLAQVIVVSKSGTERVLEKLRQKERKLRAQASQLTQLNEDLQQQIAERQRAMAALRKSETRFRTAVDSYPEILVIYDQDLRYRFANNQAMQFFGWTPDTIWGRQDEELFPPDVVEIYLPVLKRTIESGQLQVEERQVLWEGEELTLILTYVPLYDEEEQLSEIVGIVQDITLRKQAEKALQEERKHLARQVQERTSELSKANAQLIDAIRTKDEFLATINHELRTPLTSIMLGTQMLQSAVYGEPAPEQKQFLDMIERNSQHLLTLINNILHFSKLEAGRFEPVLTDIDVPAICHACMDVVSEMARQKNISLPLVIDTPVARLQADERCLKQILVNLLSNAVKFTHENGTVGVRVSSDLAQQTMSFTVWDTGIGIAPEDMSHLFQPFMQIDSSLSRQYEGSGLGLALVKRLTELHGGSVSLQSRVNKGSQFTVSLPLPVIPDADQPSSQPPAVTTQPMRISNGKLHEDAAEPPAQSPYPYKILVAEDTEHTLKTLELYLRYRKCQVVVARNGLEAVERAMEEMPDVILMDIQMPVLTGLEAIRRIREHATTSHIPIIALTALTMPGDRERCLDAGANLYVPKPVHMNGLYKMIEQLYQTNSSEAVTST